MGKDSGIQWTHHTFNPHWGCARVSPGCENCYAETFAHRLGFKIWGAGGERREFGDKHWAEPLKWDIAAERAGARHRVFCASMADVFEDHPVAARSRARLWPIIGLTPHLDWLLLTKRPENIWQMLPEDWRAAGPWPNVWLGTTVEDRPRKARIAHLQAVAAAVRFLSVEPLLQDLGALDLAGIDWVIIGGESGHGARVFDCAHARLIIEQCRDAGVAVFVKQMGAIAIDADAGTLAPLVLKDRGHGGDISEFPEDLRIREFPPRSHL